MPVLINPEIIGASFPVKASDQPYHAMYFGRSCVNHCKPTVSMDSCRKELVSWRQSYNISDGDLAERLNWRATQAEKNPADLVGPSSRA